jgi:hypothetical protein
LTTPRYPSAVYTTPTPSSFFPSQPDPPPLIVADAQAVLSAPRRSRSSRYSFSFQDTNANVQVYGQVRCSSIAASVGRSRLLRFDFHAPCIARVTFARDRSLLRLADRFDLAFRMETNRTVPGFRNQLLAEVEREEKPPIFQIGPPARNSPATPFDHPTSEHIRHSLDPRP